MPTQFGWLVPEKRSSSILRLSDGIFRRSLLSRFDTWRGNFGMAAVAFCNWFVWTAFRKLGPPCAPSASAFAVLVWAGVL